LSKSNWSCDYDDNSTDDEDSDDEESDQKSSDKKKNIHLILLAVLHQSDLLTYSEAVQNAHINEISSSSDEVFATKKQLAGLHMKDLIELASYREVMNSCQCDYWIAVMQAEINELTRIEIWKLVKLSKK